MAIQYSVPQLEKALKRQKVKLDKLIHRRKRLQKELSRLEKQITKISGFLQGKKRVKRRPKNTKTILAAVRETLAKHKKGLTVRDLATEVLAAGYRTSSANFHNTLYQCLYHNADQWVHDANAHTYRLK